MAEKAKRPCSKPGCPRLTSGGYCPAHHRPADERASASRRGYGRRWQRYRLMFLSRHPICEDPSGCEEPATDVDHIQAVDGPGDPLFWRSSNHRALCHGHHSRKTALVDRGFGHSPRRATPPAHQGEGG